MNPSPEPRPPQRIDLDSLQRLAALDIPAERRAQLCAELEGLLADFCRLQEVDTEGVPASRHPLDQELVTRPDTAGAVPKSAEVLAQAPARRDDSFVVPRAVQE